MVVDYRDLTAAPRDTVLSVYAALGIEVTGAFDAWLRAQGEREKNHQSRFDYSLGEFLLSAEAIHDQLQEFYSHYLWETSPVPEEHKHAG
jgi:hypothetical protein